MFLRREEIEMRLPRGIRFRSDEVILVREKLGLRDLEMLPGDGNKIGQRS